MDRRYRTGRFWPKSQWHLALSNPRLKAALAPSAAGIVTRNLPETIAVGQSNFFHS